MIEEEINFFNASIIKWSNKWWGWYCFADDKITKDFENDRDLYFKFFLNGQIKADVINKTIDLSTCSFNHKINEFKDHFEDLSRWKFRNRSNKILEKAKKLHNYHDVSKTYTKSSLVSLIFWFHVFKPFEYPLFDQRTLRTFLLLWNGQKDKNSSNYHPKSLWLGGVPSGNNIYDFYNGVFKSLILKTVTKESKGNDKKKFILLRKIDWALFAFDKYLISPCIGKSIPISESIKTKLSLKLSELSIRNYKMII